MNLEDFAYEDLDLSGEKSVADKWILTRLNETIEQVTRNIDKYDFGEAGRYLYNFIWDDFCDWYIEMAKLPLYGEDEEQKRTTKSVLIHTLDSIMKLLHPFMPFITEEIWQHIPHKGKSITVAAWPQVNEAYTDQESAKRMERLVAIIRAVRNIRAEVNTPMSKEIRILVKASDESIVNELEDNRHYLEKFCNPEDLQISTDIQAPEQSKTAVVSGAELFFPLEGLVNLEEELSRLQKELNKWQSEVELVQKKLSNEKFVQKAPEKLVQQERDKEKDYLEKRKLVEERIQELEKLK